MEDTLSIKIKAVFDDESHDLFKEEVRKIVKDIIKEEIKNAFKKQIDYSKIVCR